MEARSPQVDSNHRPSAYQTDALTGLRLAELVGCPGLEPGAPGLRVRCTSSCACNPWRYADSNRDRLIANQLPYLLGHIPVLPPRGAAAYVPRPRLELGRREGHRNLNPARLPVSAIGARRATESNCCQPCWPPGFEAGPATVSHPCRAHAVGGRPLHDGLRG